MRIVQVGVYGGSFNPPHVAHVLGAAYVLSCTEVSELLIVPVCHHAFSKDLAPFEDRVAMAELALGWLPGVRVSGIEAELPRPSYSLNTLTELARRHPDWQLRFVIGSDVLHERDKWHDFEGIAKLAPLLVLGRAGFEHPEAPAAILPDVSSTRIRELLGQPSSPSRDAELSRFVPRRVLDYVEAHGLYR